ncbi:Lanthionine synthetase C-like protein [Chitinophaga sp. CF118]|uniref:lanthionine synthetase C family protein n=1 Tax=Chitinophaga sp. CF118 TaxID=1884367 RepID=UPI0008EE38A1|nr:lanthionine synthetase C family protein [Chitinophaga sp. CF118]SFE76798.1 Lanthionine synthetase C-like protein [Chitinophaga sp. CF118]
MDYKKDAIRVLQEISVALDYYTEQENLPGLLSGYSGYALFYAYYYNLTGKKKHLKKVHQLLLKSIQALSEEALIPSHCNGVSGMVWAIQHLINTGFASEDGLEDTFEEVDVLLGNIMEQQVVQEEYDFLHQGLGIALYFLEKEQPSPYLNTLVKQLEKTAYKDEKGLRWRDHFSRTQAERPEEPAFNLGLAHGIPAIISVLGKIHQKGIDVSPLLDQSISWLLSTKNKPEEGISSLYPVLVDTRNEAMTGKQSRLGWCYGDLSIAATLMNVGMGLQNDLYKEEAHRIFTHTLQHRNTKNGSVHDACFCHGGAGIAHIYRRAYLATEDPLFLEGADHWLQQTLQMNTWKDGLAGFKFYADEKYINCYGLLEGITGLGLVLIAALDPATTPAWDRCLLLS